MTDVARFALTDGDAQNGVKHEEKYVNGAMSRYNYS